jgi:endoglycosylceramidase
LGFNVVRLPISWALFEPRPGILDFSYLSRYVSRDVSYAKKHGLFIVLDMHQYNWARRFGGSGVPDWSVQSYAPNEVGKREAISNFWINTKLQAHFLRAWSEIARTYANETAVAGYDILNEPWIYTSVIPYLNAKHVDALYLKVINSIRAVDPNHIIFLEPANMYSSKFPVKDNIVWSPHFYPLSFVSTYRPQDARALEADLQAKLKRFALEMGGPIWIGEFGAFMKDESHHDWLRDATTLFDKYMVGWAWWAFGQELDGTGNSMLASVCQAVSK